MKITKVWMWLAVFSMVFLAACWKNTVEQWAVVNFSYEVVDPMTQELISQWEKEITFDYTWSEVYKLMEGAVKWDTRTDVLTDPFNEHNPDLTYRQTALVLNEMWIPVVVGSKVQLTDSEAVVTNVLSVDGIEQVELDANPVWTISPAVWTLTVTSIK